MDDRTFKEVSHWLRFPRPTLILFTNFGDTCVRKPTRIKNFYYSKNGIFILKYNLKKKNDLKSNVELFSSFFSKEKQNTYKKI